MRYRKKPIEVEAEQWFFGKEVKGITEAFPAADSGGEIWPAHATVVTMQGQKVTLFESERVIQESDGVHAYPCDPVEFERIYEPVKDES